MSTVADCGILKEIQLLREARDESYRRDLKAIDRQFETEMVESRARSLFSIEETKIIAFTLLAIVATLIPMLFFE
jgi:hypothetical protein